VPNWTVDQEAMRRILAGASSPEAHSWKHPRERSAINQALAKALGFKRCREDDGGSRMGSGAGEAASIAPIF